MQNTLLILTCDDDMFASWALEVCRCKVSLEKKSIVLGRSVVLLVDMDGFG
jgi:hypothetical protein